MNTPLGHPTAEQIRGLANAEIAENTLTVLCALLAARQTEHGPVRYPKDIDKTIFAEGYKSGKYAISFGGGEISIVTMP